VSRRPIGGSLGALAAFGAVLVTGLVCLAIAAGTEDRATAFSVDVPAPDPVAIVVPGQRVCQGPISVTASTDGLTAWMAPGPTAGVSFEARLSGPGSSPVRTTLRPGSSTPSAGLPALSGRFSPVIRSGRRVRLCVRSTSRRTVELLGGPVRSGSGALVLGGKISPYSLALVFRSSHPRSVLSLMPTMFARAALFKPRWVGAWTFWVLLAAILAAGVLGLGWALRAAAQGEDPPSGG
jgi:hypothetical protein